MQKESRGRSRCSYMARTEARALRKLVGRNGDTVETVRELIGVEPQEESQLLAYARECPEEEPFIRKALQFRREVAGEFERLVSQALCSVVGSPDYGGVRSCDVPAVQGAVSPGVASWGAPIDSDRGSSPALSILQSSV